MAIYCCMCLSCEGETMAQQGLETQLLVEVSWASINPWKTLETTLKKYLTATNLNRLTASSARWQKNVVGSTERMQMLRLLGDRKLWWPDNSLWALKKTQLFGWKISWEAVFVIVIVHWRYIVEHDWECIIWLHIPFSTFFPCESRSQSDDINKPWPTCPSWTFS